MKHSCASIALNISTYIAGKNQPTHPNVISFSEPWHGYKYYMAYTPYPYANGSEENPCLAGSNDLLDWKKPEGLINPIACCEEHECDELKDSHLLYRDDLDRLEMWYLGRDHSTMRENGLLHCFRKTSADGISWSPSEIMYVFSDINLASPSIHWSTDHYEFWGIRNDRTEIGTYHMSSFDGYNWSALTKCIIPDAEKTAMWHGTVSLIDNKYCYVWVGNSKTERQHIYYAESLDGMTFTHPKCILTNDTDWHYLYRPCIIMVDDMWYCYYGVIRYDGKWMISVSYGSSLEELTGIDASDTSNDGRAVQELISVTPKMKIKHILRKVRSLFVIKPLVLIPFLLIIRLAVDIDPIISFIIAIVLNSFFSYFCINKKTAIQQGMLMGTVSSCIIAFLNEIIEYLI